MEKTSYKFDIPTNPKSIIKVMGVGGGGSNAINYMYNKGIKDVEFIVCNTDIQALNMSAVPTKLQIGGDLTEGLGAGANPEIGREAALESKEDIRELLSHNTKMLFITAGMGGGTGTGAAPVIAEIARELGILTVAIVTFPFMFEGRKKRKYAEEGLNSIKEQCDTLLVISNDKLREIYGNLKMSEAFAQADNILTTAAKGIAEIITVPGYVNVDFEDVKTVMRGSGAAVMGSAKTEGDNRALRASQEALNSPLLNSRNIHGAQKILLSIMSGDKSELQMDELTSITEYIQEQVGDDADMIFGNGIDPELGDSLRVTIIATGFKDEIDEEEPKAEEKKIPNPTTVKKEEPQEVPRDYVFNVTKNPSTEETNPNTSFQTDTQIDPPKKSDKVVFNLDDEKEGNNPYDVKNQKSEIELKREQLNREADERVHKLKKLSKSFDGEAFQEKIEVPAYLRRNVKLEDNPNSEEDSDNPYNMGDEGMPPSTSF